MFLTLLPTWLKELLVGLLAFLLAILAGYLYGEYKYNEGKKSEMALQVTLETKVDASSLAATAPIVFTLEQAQVKYQASTNTIIKEVPTYVTREDDSKCPVPNSFVSLWNAANQVWVPGDTATVPSGTSQVVLSDIATQHAVEAGLLHNDEAMIEAMQMWLETQQEVYDKTR